IVVQQRRAAAPPAGLAVGLPPRFANCSRARSRTAPASARTLAPSAEFAASRSSCEARPFNAFLRLAPLARSALVSDERTAPILLAARPFERSSGSGYARAPTKLPAQDPPLSAPALR